MGATRKSRLATLDGFRFFTLLKRVATEGMDEDARDYEEGNYVSFTIWENKDNFNAWRTPYHYLAFSPQLSAANENAKGGWRQVDADGKNEIRPEVFVSMDQYSVKHTSKVEFEQFFAKKDEATNGNKSSYVFRG